MTGIPAQLTRRQLLMAAGSAGTALGVTALLGHDVLGGSSHLPALSPTSIGNTFSSAPGLRLPTVSVTTHTPSASEGLIFLAPYNAPEPAQAGLLIVNNAGQPVWESPLPLGTVATNLQVQSFRGRPVLTWWQGNIVLGHGVGHYVVTDSQYRTVATIQAGNGLMGDLHEFVLTDKGTALMTSYRLVKADLTAYGGPKDGTVQDSMLQERDIASGRVLLEWHSYGSVPLSESYWPAGNIWDYFHINSIDVDTDGNLLVSSRNTHTIYKLERSTGQIMWRLGGKHSNFALGSGATFAWQHDARRQPNGTITVFDNGASPEVEPQSRAISLNVDETGRRVTLASQFTHQPQLLATSQGSVQMLPNGNTFVGWGAEPYVTEFTANGQVVFDAHLPSQYECYRAFREQWVGAPAAAPLVVTSRSRDQVALAVSWNGDTRTDRWLVLAGASERSLAPVAMGRRAGFETAIVVRTSEPLLAVRALTSNGVTLGQSATVRV